MKQLPLSKKVAAGKGDCKHGQGNSADFNLKITRSLLRGDSFFDMHISTALYNE